MKRNRKIIIAFSVTVCVLFALLVVLSLDFGSAPPDPQAATPDQTAEYLASEQFVKMDRDDKEQYLDKISRSYSETPMLTLFLNSSLSEVQRQKLMENILPVIGPGISQRIDEFESLSPREQTARLDAIIDRMEQYRQSNPGTMFSPERFNLILQYIDPHIRARIRKHIPAMRQRMSERGITSTYLF
jgi:hypothetical protein